MVDRFLYYAQKAIRLAKSRGIQHSASISLDFVKRRVLSGQLLKESLEYRILSSGRDISATLLRTPWQKEIAPSNRWMIYASYDPHSRIQPHIIQQLRAFSDLGYSILFVSTSPELPDPEVRQHLAPWCVAVIHRSNRGYDFASWKLAFQLYRDRIFSPGHSVESLILMNDSCLGPFGDLKLRVQQMTSARNGVYGITKSYEITEYIQSYFLHFGADLLPRVLDLYMDQIRILHSKSSVVRFLEIGLSRWLRDQGIPLRALVDPREEPAASLMKKYKITDPVLAPVADPLRDLGALPFYKRSNTA